MQLKKLFNYLFVNPNKIIRKKQYFQLLHLVGISFNNVNKYLSGHEHGKFKKHGKYLNYKKIIKSVANPNTFILNRIKFNFLYADPVPAPEYC